MKFIDMAGRTCGYLTVLSLADRTGSKIKWLCDSGRELVARHR